MRIGEALARALDGIAEAGLAAQEPASPITGYRGRLARMNALQKEHGGPREAAAAVGVQYRTWKLWRTPLARPTAASLGKLGRSVARIYQRAAVSRFLRRVPRAPRVTATIRWGDSGRYYARKNDGYRSTNLDDLYGKNLAQLTAAWASRDLDQLAQLFEQAVSDIYGRQDDLIQFEGNRVEVEW